MNGGTNVAGSQHNGAAGCCHFLKTGVVFSGCFSVLFCGGGTCDWSNDDVGEGATGERRGIAMFQLLNDAGLIIKDGARLCSWLRCCCSFPAAELVVLCIMDAMEIRFVDN